MTRTLMILAAGCAAIAMAGQAAAAVSPKQLEANRKIATDMMKALQHQNVEGAAALLDDGYIQHNPNVPTGKVGFVGYFSKIWPVPKPGADWINPPVLVTAEGDIVQMTFKRMTPDPANPGKTYESFWWDTLRVANGKIVEHWDPATKPIAPPAPR